MVTTKSGRLKQIILTNLFQITFIGNYQNRNFAISKVFLGTKESTILLSMKLLKVEMYIY